MAVVYRGLDPSLDREVAIKVLHPHLANNPQSKERFHREARAVARLRHPHIIEIFDFAETAEGESYIVTEFVRGKTLRAFMEDNHSFFPEVGAMIAIQVCEAVAHAHELKIIHRDLKPDNIMVDESGTLKLMDFGIAKVIDQQQQMTLTGSILGSPAHMAPELLKGKELDLRSDLFSVGTILYWLATGTLPFTGNNPHQVFKRIIDAEYPHPQQVNPAISSTLTRIIDKALASEPEQRFQSALAMQTELFASLTELDLDDVDAELKYFFEAPSGYLQALRQKISVNLLAKGKTLLKAGMYRQALEALDRLLALDPDQQEVVALIDGIRRQQRLRQRLMKSMYFLITLCLVGAVLWTIWSHWPQKQELAPDAGTVALAPIGLPDAGPVDAGPVDAGSANADANIVAEPSPADHDRVRSRADQKRHAHLRPARKTVHPVQIFADPYFDSIWIDGKQVASNDRSTGYGQRYFGKLKTGQHRVVIRHNACQKDEFDITVPSKEPFRRKLRFLPALLVVQTDLSRAGVYVDANFKGSAAQSLVQPITITLEGRKPKREVRLRVVDRQAGEFRTRVQVTAGKKTVVQAKRAEFQKASVEAPVP